MTLIAHLPREVLRDILRNFVGPSSDQERSDRNLLAITRVSRLFHALAQPFLHTYIPLKSNTNAILLLSNEEFGRHYVEELYLVGREDSPVGVKSPTAAAVIAIASKMNLKKLTLSHFTELDPGVLELAGSELKSLDLPTRFTISTSNEAHSEPSLLPFQLHHLSLYGSCERPPSLLSTIVKSSTSIRSLQVEAGDLSPELVSLPQFPPFAASVTSLTLIPKRTGRLADFVTAFPHFTSVTHLKFLPGIDVEEEGRRFEHWFDFLKHFPAERPTITDLTLPATQEYFQYPSRLDTQWRTHYRPQDRMDSWSRIKGIEALGALEQITWSHLWESSTSLVPRLMLGDRVIKMAWKF
ncbi:hypothetical protein P7C70_g8357, partial [Phenoliferia sp. Uapishka_3]